MLVTASVSLVGILTITSDDQAIGISLRAGETVFTTDELRHSRALIGALNASLVTVTLDSSDSSEFVSQAEVTAAIAAAGTAATETERGEVELATQSEAFAGTATNGTDGPLSIRPAHLLVKKEGTALVSVSEGTAPNARGANSLDIQSERDDATQVASGTSSTAIGLRNTASGAQSTAIGRANTASAKASAFGFANHADNDYAVALGYNNFATSKTSVAVGIVNNSTATVNDGDGYITPGASTPNGINSTAVGIRSVASTLRSTAVGFKTVASGGSSTSVGDTNTASGTRATAAGFNNLSSGYYSIAAGYMNSATEKSSVAVGILNNSSGTLNNDTGAISSPVLGTSTINSTAVGINNTCGGVRSIAVGFKNTTAATGDVAVGVLNSASGSMYGSAVAIGHANTSTSVALSIGKYNSSVGGGCAIGNSNIASGYGAGPSSRSTACGTSNTASGLKSSAFGDNCDATAERASAFGHNAQATAFASNALGDYASANVSYTTAIQGPIIAPKTGSWPQAYAFGHLSGVQDVLWTVDVDLTDTATLVFDIPSGAKFYIDEVGIIVTQPLSVILQPTISWGTSGDHDKYKAATLMTLLDGEGRRERFSTMLADVAETTLAVEITVGGTVSSGVYRGKMYFKGLLIEAEPL